jgi:hypothetical protein
LAWLDEGAFGRRPWTLIDVVTDRDDGDHDRNYGQEINLPGVVTPWVDFPGHR